MSSFEVRRPAWCALLAAASTLLALLSVIGVQPALAQSAYLRISTSDAPTNLPPGGKGTVVVNVTNLGDATLGTGTVIADKLPAGLTVTAVVAARANQFSETPSEDLECSIVSATEVRCADLNYLLPPLTGLKMVIQVKVGTQVAGANRVEATSGTVKTVAEQPVKISAEPAPFEIEKYALEPEEEGGGADVRAGSHPFQLITSLGVTETGKEEPVSLTKNLKFSLPPGLIGNPNATKQCSQTDFNTILPGPINLCGPETAVGEAQVTIEEPTGFSTGPQARTVPIFNLEPAPGEPARFGLVVEKDPVVLDTAVRTGSDYGIVVTASSSSEVAGLISSTVSFWGVPGDSRHNSQRGWNCAANGELVGGPAACEAQQKKEAEVQQTEKAEGKEPAPFLALPTSCGMQLAAPAQIQSWVPGAQYTPAFQSEFSESLESCNLLPFNPSISVRPETQSGSSPTGLAVDVEVPQPETPEGLAESAVRSTTVALPEGIELSPAAAGGLLACSASQVGFIGGNESSQTENDQFSPELASCPDAAKVGTVSIESPDLANPLTGGAYLATQDTNPFKSPLVLYLIARDPVSGVLVKLAGSVSPNGSTGQLVSTFANTPQVPFKSLKLNFFGGGRASLSTPPGCGTYTTTSSFTPWSGNPAATPSAAFSISSGPGGGGCTSEPFAPTFQAGVTSNQAGAFSPFTLTIGNPDGDQALGTLTMHLPSGAAALLSSVTPCPEPSASENACGSESLIGHSSASSGLGGEPYTLPGSVYLTGPYKGAPFGLSVVTPAVAGPFNLGDVTVRSTINVNPETAAVTITSDPFPTIIKGVPTQLKQINVTVDRPSFEFNPTNCNPMSVTGTLTGAKGASANVASPFQVANCASLPFTPKLTATAGGQASKADGASLNVLVTSAGLGQDNIAKVDLTLPQVLPSRLSTIQKACVLVIFEANPAACDEGSVIGKATISTPVLKSPLMGPAYLVSHGGAAFPDVEFVLQGEGITLVLDGKTDIKKGITYSRFEATPDAPFTSFITELPTGPHSALTAYVPASKKYSLCGTPLVMPTEITAQSGAVIRQTTNIVPTGCNGVASYKVSRAQQLAKALKLCHKKKSKAKRRACERQAHKKYGPKKSKKVKSKSKKR